MAEWSPVSVILVALAKGYRMQRIGACLLPSSAGTQKVILVRQGTFEPYHSKLIHPTLEAFKDSDYLVLVATGFHHTETLRKKYPHQNIIIEDFMDLDEVMPKCRFECSMHRHALLQFVEPLSQLSV